MKTHFLYERKPLIRLLAFICTLAMLLSVAAVLPITAGAKTTTYSIKNQDDFEKAINKAKSNKSDHAYFRFDSDMTIVLDENLPTSYSSELYLFLLDKMNVTFDLNGKAITFKMTPRCNYASTQKSLDAELPFFYIADTELTIKDSSAVNGQTGTGIMKFEAEEKGDHPYVPFLVYVVDFNSQVKHITLESGTLDGSSCNYSQSCFYLYAHSLVMNGGVIQNFHGKEGGAINNQRARYASGAVTINGGTIKNCSATVNGGAIYNAGDLFLNGGTIVGCEATGDNTDTSRGRGGALYCATGSTTTLSGTAISTNKAVNGGGIFMWGGTLNMTGGSLMFNTATSNGSELCMFHTDKQADVVFNMTGGSILSTLKNPSAIYAGSDKDKVNISGTAAVNAWGKDYAIVNGSASNVSISASAQVKARSESGKAFMYAPTVNGNATAWTRSDLGDFNFSPYTRIPSPTEADYQRHYVWITYAGTSTVTFNDDGTPIYTATQPVGTIIQIPSNVLNPSKGGFTFNEWNSYPDKGSLSNGFYTFQSTDEYFTADWAPLDTYVIKFVKGGDAPAGDIQSLKKKMEDSFTLPTHPTLAGYTFEGWYVGDTKLGNDGQSITMAHLYLLDLISGNTVTVTARYKARSYTLTIKPENGEQDIVRTVKYGDPLNLPTDITKTGHAFDGWDGVPADSKMPANDLTVTAKWTKNSYTLTIVKDNGEQDIVRTVAYGADLNLPTDLTKTGHAFTGWEGATADNKMPANDLTVTAKWTKNSYTLTIKLDNGQADIVRTVAYGADLNLPTDPTKTGHAFNGWEGATADNKMPAQDLTVTATWRKIGFESVTIDPTADLTLHLTAYLPEGNAAATLRVTLDGKTVELQPTAGATLDVYNFTYTGVTPYVLSHSLTLELVLGEQVIDSRTTSAAEICVEVAQAQPELKQTVADLMAFCAATADYLGYDDTTAAAIRGLMAANGLTASDREVDLTDSKRIGARPAGDTRLLGVGLYFENTTGMYVRFKTSNVSRVTLTVGQTTYTAEDFAQKDWTEFVLYLPGVSLDDLTEVNHVSLCVNGQEIQSMDYAISDYIAVTHKGTGTYSAGIRALTKALYNWKESAEAV